MLISLNKPNHLDAAENIAKPWKILQSQPITRKEVRLCSIPINSASKLNPSLSLNADTKVPTPGRMMFKIKSPRPQC